MSDFEKSLYHTTSAVLFLIFNRPTLTQRVFEQIKAARPQRLYVAADGPREGFPDDGLLCRQTREIIAKIDWDCQLKTLFREENLGCRDGVSAAISWFFNYEEEGIVLEDDCLPANSFFRFCDIMLEKYRTDSRIRHITGCNLQQGKKWGNASYYFSNRTHVWGWASWRRVWDEYDKTLCRYDSGEIKRMLKNIYDDELIIDCWANIFNEVKTGKINSWAYQLDFENFFNNGLTIIPNENLVSNIGFLPGATNTIMEDHVFANVPLSEIIEITDPVFVVPEKQADLFIMNHHFQINKESHRTLFFIKSIKKWKRSLSKWVGKFIFSTKKISRL